MIELPSLFPHQEDQRDRVRAAIAKHRAVIACAPPGTGKTRLSKWMLGAFSQKERKENQSGHALFTVHRRGLVDNATGSFAEEPALEHGVIMSGRETMGNIPIQVASIDTLLSWFCEGGQYVSDQTYDFIVMDEAHSHHSKLQTFLKAHNAKREELGLHEPYVLGLTATPQAKGLSDLYKEIVSGPSTVWLIDNGFLSPFRYFRATEGKLDRLVMRGQEYTPDSVSSAMEGLSGDLIRDWKKHASDRATVGFFPRRAHAREAMEQLKAAGVWCEYVDGETKDEDRRNIYKALNDGVIQYICNVGVIERGTDIPRIGCVQLCTAIGNIVRYKQMVGRGSRIHSEKTDCLILDHGGNILRHGFFEDEVNWTLDWSERPSKDHEARPVIECPNPNCNAIYRGGKCRQCGYEPTARERRQKGLVFDGTELKEVKRKEKPKAQKSNEEIWIGALYACGYANRTFRQALAIAYATASKQGTEFRVPSRFRVAGKTYRTIPKGAYDQSRRVRETYGFTVKDYSDGANPYQLQETHADEAF